MIQEFLRTVPLFRDFDEEELTQVLMASLVKRHPAGAAILTEGTPGGQLHLILQGEVRISKLIPGGGEEAITILGAGDFFGEAEFLDGAPSSAHAISHGECDVLTLPHQEVASMMGSQPRLAAKFLWAFARTLASRLRDTNGRMAALLAMSGHAP